jgi:hypothetical protein
MPNVIFCLQVVPGFAAPFYHFCNCYLPFLFSRHNNEVRSFSDRRTLLYIENNPIQLSTEALNTFMCGVAPYCHYQQLCSPQNATYYSPQ